MSEADDDGGGGDEVDLDVVVDLVIGLVVVAESMGTGSTMTAGIVADDDGAAEFIAVEVLFVGAGKPALAAGEESVNGFRDSRPIKKNATMQTTMTMAMPIASNLDRFRGGGWVWLVPLTVAMSISSCDIGPLEGIEIGSRVDGVDA